MTTIDDLNQSISDMTDEALYARLHDMRHSRRTHKETMKATKARKPVAKKLNITTDLIKELEGLMKT